MQLFNTWGELYSVFSLSLGVSSGAILVFDIPSKGSNITLSEVLEEHKEAITDMASECSGSQVMMLCVLKVTLYKPLFIRISVHHRAPEEIATL